MSVLDDAKGINVAGTANHVIVTIISASADNPSTLISPEKAIKIGQLMIKVAHQIIQFNERVISGND